MTLQADPNLLDGKYVPPIMPTVMDSRVSKVNSATIDPTVNQNGWVDPGTAAGQQIQITPPPAPPKKASQ
ncbi:MAG: hypothetical protein JOY92_04800 [Verrucomicrobia bacterium]|nr:hypothetical protein [Verrucomicrobiota bacterium]